MGGDREDIVNEDVGNGNVRSGEVERANDDEKLWDGQRYFEGKSYWILRGLSGKTSDNITLDLE
jgi:hypothetical protein